MTSDNTGSSPYEQHRSIADPLAVVEISLHSDVISGRALAALDANSLGGYTYTDGGGFLSRLPTPPTAGQTGSVGGPSDAVGDGGGVGGVGGADAWTHCELAADIAIGTVLSLLVVFAVAGNLLVIAAILTDRALRQTGNYFLVSLALADTLVALAVMTFAIANDVLGRWPFGRVLCDVWVSADVMCSTASILNLSAVSLDRYIHIRR